MALAPASRLVARGASLTGAAVAGTGALGWLWSLCGEPARALADPLLRGGPGALDGLSFERALTGGAAVVLMPCALWLVAVTVVAVAAQLAAVRSGGAWLPARVLSTLADRTCPALVQGLVAAAVGAAVTTVVATPAFADPPGDGCTATGLTGLALPDRVLAPSQPEVLRTAPRPPPRTVLVRRGDSLWSIASGLLPAQASDRRTAGAWRLLYRANADRIGADPDLILPGTPLVVPPLLAPRRKDRP